MHSLFKICFLTFIFSFSCLSITAQDSIPIDTTIVKTVVIRSKKTKIKIIPRGLKNINPKKSYEQSAHLDKYDKPFVMPSFWIKKNNIALNFSEVAFVDWNAGGNNSAALLMNANFSRKYKFRYIQWENTLSAKYGVNAQEEQKARKTVDEIRISSTFGYRKDTLTNWYYSVKTKFNSQFTNGYKYPDREKPISKLMSPGYVFIGAGTEYSLDDKDFSFYASPMTLKATFVLDQELANAGAFGVKKAKIDDEGNIITEGENSVKEFGILLTSKWDKEIYKNVFLANRINLYTDYLNSFGNIDLDWELNFKFVINSYFKANIGAHMIYDDDILFDEVKDDKGQITQQGEPRIQLKQTLGIGFSYDF